MRLFHLSEYVIKVNLAHFLRANVFWIHGLQTPKEAFFHWKPELMGRQIGQINSGTFGVFLAELFWYSESLIHFFHYSTIISPKKQVYIHIPNIYLGLGFEIGPQRIGDLAFLCPWSVSAYISEVRQRSTPNVYNYWPNNLSLHARKKRLQNKKWSESSKHRYKLIFLQSINLNHWKLSIRMIFLCVSMTFKYVDKKNLALLCNYYSNVLGTLKSLINEYLLKTKNTT